MRFILVAHRFELL